MFLKNTILQSAIFFPVKVFFLLGAGGWNRSKAVAVIYMTVYAAPMWPRRAAQKEQHNVNKKKTAAKNVANKIYAIKEK